MDCDSKSSHEAENGLGDSCLCDSNIEYCESMAVELFRTSLGNRDGDVYKWALTAMISLYSALSISPSESLWPIIEDIKYEKSEVSDLEVELFTIAVARRKNQGLGKRDCIKEIISMLHSKHSYLRSRERRVVQRMCSFTQECAEKVGVENIVHLFALDEQKRTARKNTCKVLAGLGTKHSTFVCAILAADFAFDNETIRLSVLRTISCMKVFENEDLVIPILEFGIASQSRTILAAALRACGALALYAKKRDATMHILNLTWYFILNKTVMAEFDDCVAKIAKRLPLETLMEYLLPGLVHFSNNIRKRYVSVYRSIHWSANQGSHHRHSPKS